MVNDDTHIFLMVLISLIEQTRLFNQLSSLWSVKSLILKENTDNNSERGRFDLDKLGRQIQNQEEKQPKKSTERFWRNVFKRF
jgi:hypothetical protein